MNLQRIKSLGGQDEYVLLPIKAYQQLKSQIDQVLKKEDYVPFQLEDYVENAIARLRIQSNLTQAQLADILQVSQAYISKIENQKTVSPKLMLKVQAAIGKFQ